MGLPEKHPIFFFLLPEWGCDGWGYGSYLEYVYITVVTSLLKVMLTQAMAY